MAVAKKIQTGPSTNENDQKHKYGSMQGTYEVEN